MPVATRVVLAYLVITGAVVGVWAYAFPTLFYSSFPGFGLRWVSMDGPFNQHLIRDVGAAYLMIASLAGLGLIRPAAAPPFTVGFATMCFNILHFAYHMTHLGMYGHRDQLMNFVTLGLAVLCSGWLMAPQARAGA